jgi:Fur family transcriptional regulator, peroxide stress response regulator
MMSRADRYDQLRRECTARGLRMTPQRDTLLRVLSTAEGHPTADQLVQAVRKSLPSVSHATVYRNVQELVRIGLIGTLQHASAAAQFEINPDTHHHFVCGGCGEVWDVYLDDVDFRVNKRSQLKGFRIERGEVQLHGLCVRCR